MTIPLLTPVASVPVRGEAASNTAFRIAVDGFLNALPPLSEEVNDTATAMNALAVTLDALAEAVADDRATITEYHEAIEAIWAAVIAEVTSGGTGGSGSSVAIGTGTKSFTASTGRLWYPEMLVMIRSDASAANFMVGAIQSYDPGTGALVVGVFRSGGAGSYTDWLIAPVGARHAGWTEVATLATTSGSAVTFSDVDDLPYHDLLLEFLGVSHNSGSSQGMRVELSDDGTNWTAAINAFYTTSLVASDTLYGTAEFFGFRRASGAIRSGLGLLTANRSAGTAVSQVTAWRISAGIAHIRISPSGGSFDAGSIKLLGR